MGDDRVVMPDRRRRPVLDADPDRDEVPRTEADGEQKVEPRRLGIRGPSRKATPEEGGTPDPDPEES